MKTGTPPRLDGRTIDWSRFEEQPGDDDPTPFSFRTKEIPLRQIMCHIAHTTPETLRLIRENVHRSPMYTGQIAAIGPRYCPSIEDKIVRFPEKTRHQFFLEPEGLNTHEVYINGMSTSLPMEVQAAMVRSIPGLENAEIARRLVVLFVTPEWQPGNDAAPYGTAALHVPDTVLENPIEQRLPFLRRPLGIGTRKLQHRVLDGVERIILVTQRRLCDLECLQFDAGQKLVQRTRLAICSRIRQFHVAV